MIIYLKHHFWIPLYFFLIPLSSFTSIFYIGRIAGLDGLEIFPATIALLTAMWLALKELNKRIV